MNEGGIINCKYSFNSFVLNLEFNGPYLEVTITINCYYFVVLSPINSCICMYVWPTKYNYPKYRYFFFEYASKTIGFALLMPHTHVYIQFHSSVENLFLQYFLCSKIIQFQLKNENMLLLFCRQFQHECIFSPTLLLC